MWNTSTWPVWFVTLDNLVESSPVPVKFTDTIEQGYNGFYSHDTSFDFDAEHHIEIDKSLKNYKKIAVLVHEIGHAKCDEKNCDCMKNPNRKYREIHAYVYELEWLLKHKQKRGLEWVMNKLASWAKYNSDYYARAAKRIMKLKLWQKCLDYINNP